jgi:hypothetical protein
LTIVALWPLRVAAYYTIERMKPEEHRLIVELREGEPITPFLASLHDVRHFELSDKGGHRVVQLELAEVDEDVVARLADLPSVIGVRWQR